MIIRLAAIDDLKDIIIIYKNAIKVMEKNNIFQWDEIYPSDSIVEQDIIKKQMFVGMSDNTIVSVGVINTEFDDDYKNGKWKYNNDCFAIIHRLCVNPTYQNQRIGKNTMLLYEDLLRKEKYVTIRLDAFSLNSYALKLYESLGYKKVGEANWRKGLFYLFEKKL